MNVSVADRADRREAHASPRIVKINRPAMSALNKPGTEGCETVIESYDQCRDRNVRNQVRIAHKTGTHWPTKAFERIYERKKQLRTP